MAVMQVIAYITPLTCFFFAIVTISFSMDTSLLKFVVQATCSSASNLEQLEKNQFAQR